MKYNGFYFALFRGTMKKVLAEHCGRAYAGEIIKASLPLYRAQAPAQGGGEGPQTVHDIGKEGRS